MPVVFLGHGSPMNAIEDNAFHRSWAELGARLPRPNAILCVSAHWETQGVGVTAMERPRTIHDFYGFPQALFDVQYPAPGDPALARRVASLLGSHRPTLDTAWGLDHGSWGVLTAMYPGADIPVVQLSLDMTQPGAYHYDAGRALKPLRDKAVLIVGSGNIVHNLPAFFRAPSPEPQPWVASFDALIAASDIATQGGGFMLLVCLGALVLSGLTLLGAIDAGDPLMGTLSVILFLVFLFTACGFYTLQANEAAAVTLFGSYRGSP